MPGSSFYVSFNGRRYALPEDLEPEVTIGGPMIKEALRNGDGSADPRKSWAQGAVRGLTPRVRIDNGDLDALNAVAAQSGVTMVYSGPDGNYSGYGFLVVGDDGVKVNQGTGLADSIDFICSTGQKLQKL